VKIVVGRGRPNVEILSTLPCPTVSICRMQQRVRHEDPADRRPRRSGSHKGQPTADHTRTRRRARPAPTRSPRGTGPWDYSAWAASHPVYFVSAYVAFENCQADPSGERLNWMVAIPVPVNGSTAPVSLN
jgi:hypothetical protein